jgi:hypothetical protein
MSRADPDEVSEDDYPCAERWTIHPYVCLSAFWMNAQVTALAQISLDRKRWSVQYCSQARR